jgi:hypothetical protein
MAALTSWASEAPAVKHTESFAIEDTIRHSLNFISDRSCTGPPFSDARVMSYAGYPAFQLAISNTVETASFTVEIRGYRTKPILCVRFTPITVSDFAEWPKMSGF